jgi:hypothetical protein
LQGIFTNKDESGIPFERPNEFAGKQIAEVADQELAELIRERSRQTAERAAGIGGRRLGPGPPPGTKTTTQGTVARGWSSIRPMGECRH